MQRPANPCHACVFLVCVLAYVRKFMYLGSYIIDPPTTVVGGSVRMCAMRVYVCMQDCLRMRQAGWAVVSLEVLLNGSGYRYRHTSDKIAGCFIDLTLILMSPHL